MTSCYHDTCVTEWVVVQVEHAELRAVCHSNGESSPAFGADSWVSTESELPEPYHTHTVKS